MTIHRAISVRQPWAELILRGIKTREYRSVPTNIRERVYLYASLKTGGSPSDWRRTGKAAGGLPTGKIIGTVEITGCRWNRRRRCFEYALARPKRMRRPRVAKNQPQPVWWRPRF